MNKPNASTPVTPASARSIGPDEQVYENSKPGTAGNVPGEYQGVNDIGVSHTMEQTAQTDTERGSPGMTPEEIRAMKR